jgi:hypothetical protein
MIKYDILVVVNVAKAQRENSLSGNLWMVDTNRNNMSQNEGSNELVTACSPGSKLVWTVTPIDADLNVSITGFSGSAVTGGILTPRQDSDGWSSHVNGVTHSNYRTSGQYTMTLSVNGTSLTFDPFIDSSPA